MQVIKNALIVLNFSKIAQIIQVFAFLELKENQFANLLLNLNEFDQASLNKFDNFNQRDGKCLKSDIFCDELSYRHKIDSAIVFEQKEVTKFSLNVRNSENFSFRMLETRVLYLFLFKNYTGINFLPIIYFITKYIALRTPPIPLISITMTTIRFFWSAIIALVQPF